MGFGTEGNSNYLTGGSGGYFGTTKNKTTSNFGGYSSFAEYGKIQGGSAGAGFDVGVFFGDVEDLAGKGKTITIHAGFFAINQAYNENGNLSGFGISFGGKGYGLGASYTEDFTVDLANKLNYPCKK